MVGDVGMMCLSAEVKSGTVSLVQRIGWGA